MVLSQSGAMSVTKITPMTVLTNRVSFWGKIFTGKLYSSEPLMAQLILTEGNLSVIFGQALLQLI